MKHILLVRSGPYQVDPKSYNLQELGLAAAFKKYGIKCDVAYFHKNKNFDQIIKNNDVEIKVLWRKGIRILRSGIYPSLLKDEFLKEYDAVICSEYSQIMSILFTKKIKTYVYNGPYYNLFKIPITEPIYDRIFSNFLNSKVEKVFCKTNRSEKFLNKKGILNTVVTGVGLDTSNFNVSYDLSNEMHDVLKGMSNHRNLLYIGSISKRKNVELIIKIFNEITKYRQYDDVQLIIVGKGSNKYVNYCKSLTTKNSKHRILWLDHVDNSQVKYLYEKASIFLLPSIKEIFGMVLLEAMYFGMPVVSSNNAGADTLINNEKNGCIIDTFDQEKWVAKIMQLLNNEKIRDHIGNEAHKTIMNNFMWDNVASKMATYIND